MKLVARHARAVPPLRALLLIPNFSESIHFRPYLEPLGDEPLLRWWTRRFKERYPRIDLAVVCRSAFQEREVRPLVAEGGIRVVLADAGTATRCAAIASRRFPSRSVVLLPFGFAYAPPDLLYLAYAHHLKFRNSWTVVAGFPPGVGCEIYSAELLFGIARLRLPGLPTTPGGAADAILRAANAVGGATPALSIRGCAFDAARAYGAAPQQLPERVLLLSGRDLQVARRVHERSEARASAVDELRRWRRGSIDLNLANGQARPVVAAETIGRFAASGKARRVLFVSLTSAFSGAEQSLVQLVTSLDRSRYEPRCVVGAEGLLAKRLRQAGAKVTVLGTFGNEGVETGLSLARTIANTRPCLVHLNGPSGLLLCLVSALRGIPVISHVRTGDVRAYEAQLKGSEAIVAISEFVRREVLKLEVPSERVHVVYNGVEAGFFRPSALDRDAARKRFAIPTGGVVVSMVARFSATKRHDMLLCAAQLAKRRVPSLFLLLNGEVFGESPCYDAALDLIARQRMQGWVRIVPFVEDIREIYAASDTLVLSSEREGFGRCVIEAMAMGVPVVVANSGALPEIVEDGKSGLIAPPGDPPALAERIVAILKDHSLGGRLARAGRLRVVRKFGAARSAREVMAIYDHVLRDV